MESFKKIQKNLMQNYKMLAKSDWTEYAVSQIKS